MFCRSTHSPCNCRASGWFRCVSLPAGFGLALMILSCASLISVVARAPTGSPPGRPRIFSLQPTGLYWTFGCPNSLVSSRLAGVSRPDGWATLTVRPSPSLQCSGTKNDPPTSTRGGLVSGVAQLVVVARVFCEKFIFSPKTSYWCARYDRRALEMAHKCIDFAPLGGPSRDIVRPED